jgi:hypothetical protein
MLQHILAIFIFDVSTLTDMKKINVFMTVQWIIFMPLLLPLGIVTGAFEGIKKTFDQAASDIFENQEITS